MTRLLLCCVIVIVAVSAAPGPPSPASVLSMVTEVNDFAHSHVTTLPSCSWTRGTYYAGLSAVAFNTKNETLLEWCVAEGEYYKWQTCGAPSTNANDECIGQMYMDLVQSKVESATKLAGTEATLNIQVNRPETDDWWWVDALFMALRTFTQLSSVTGNPAYEHKGFLLFNDTAHSQGGPGLWDADAGLFYRDKSYFGKTCPNGKPVFWSRGNGWAISAFARSIPFASDAAVKAAYVAKLQAMAKSLLAVQGDDGMWRTSLLDADQYPEPETTGTALITSAMAYGIKAGYLDTATYAPAVWKAWQGLTTISFQSGGLVGWCQPVGASPKPPASNSTSDFCVGQWLLAATGVLELIQN